jgi:hypothetical protein
MIPPCHILHYKGKTIIRTSSLYKVVEFMQTYLSFTEAKREIDKRDTEFLFNPKTLNDKNGLSKKVS